MSRTRSLERANCAACGRWLAVTSEGVMRVHPERSVEKCDGSGEPPLTEGIDA